MQITCPICDSDYVRVALKLEKPLGKVWDIFECGKCLAQFIYPPPSTEELSRLYKQFYTENAEQIKRLPNPNYGILSFPRQWGIIKSLVHKKHGRILDFGCAGGHFLTRVSPEWEKYGVDISEDARKVATRKGVKTFATLEGAAFPEEFFDVVVMFATIEHLPDPRDIVTKLRRVLKSGGLFVIMTGDVRSLTARLQAENWEMYCPPGHIFYFSAYSLDFLMNSLGFKKVKTLYTDGGGIQIPFQPLNLALRVGLELYHRIPILNTLPLLATYYGYYQKREETDSCAQRQS